MGAKHPIASWACGVKDSEGNTGESSCPDVDDFEQELARLVPMQRKLRRWSQPKLAKKAKLSVGTVRWMEGGSAKRLYLRPGLRLLRLLGIRMRFVPLPGTTPRRSHPR